MSTQHRTCNTSPFWCPEFAGGSYISGKLLPLTLALSASTPVNMLDMSYIVLQVIMVQHLPLWCLQILFEDATQHSTDEGSNHHQASIYISQHKH